MQVVFFSRLAEAVFRRWWMYAAIVLLFCMIGVYVAGQRTEQYRSFGVIRVSGQSTLSEITRVGGTNALGWETAAEFTAREINAVLGTDLFISNVAERAGIGEALESGAVTTAQLQRLIWASSSSDLLVRVNAYAADPELARRLAAATIASYLQWQIDDNITDSRSAEDFFESLLTPYQERLDEAQQELQDYLATHPGPANVALRPVDEQIDMGQLTDEVERASNQLSVVTESLADAQLVTAQTETDVSQRLRIIDPPEIPLEPETGRLEGVITMAMFFALGVLVALAAAAGSALLDRTVRYPEQAENDLNLPVLAVLPNVGRRFNLRPFGSG